jgi:hypothetical protein
MFVSVQSHQNFTPYSGEPTHDAIGVLMDNAFFAFRDAEMNTA